MMQVAGLGADLDVLLAHPGIDPNAADKVRMKSMLSLLLFPWSDRMACSWATRC